MLEYLLVFCVCYDIVSKGKGKASIGCARLITGANKTSPLRVKKVGFYGKD